MKAVLFDLDYTLYDTDQYFLGAFKDIARYLEEKYRIPQKEVNRFLVKIWKKQPNVYSHIFNDLLAHYDLRHENIENIVEIFNRHDIISENHLYSDVISTLTKLRLQGYKVGIITDGNLERQQRKVRKFGLDKLVDDITYTKDTQSKPSTTPFLAALNVLHVEPSSAIYVADNPLVDFKGPKIIGMRTARILRGKFANISQNEYVDYKIQKLDEIFEILKRKQNNEE